MFVNTDIGEHIITWAHHDTQSLHLSRYYRTKWGDFTTIKNTVCEIHEPNGNVYIGTSYCSPDDNFCKDIGRKLSLTRALKKTNLNKDLRRWVWNQYFMQHRSPRRK